MLKKKNRLAILAITGVLLLGSAAWWRWQQAQPIYITGLDIPDAAKVGDIDYAIKKMQKLHALFVQFDWNTDKVNAQPLSIWTLPDQKYAEEPSQRAPDYQAIKCKTLHPKPNDIALYTDIYVRQNTKYYKGDKSVSDPHGFYLVLRGSGKAERIAVGDVRMIKDPNSETGIYAVFPGESNYDVNAPQLPFVGGDKNLAKLENLVQKHQQKH